MKNLNKKVSILLALYRPNLIWLEQLFLSIERQSFSNYEVLMIDDGSEQKIYVETEELVRRHFKKGSKASITRNDKNEGSDKTFEKLVQKAEGDYIAFCDQDDIWESNKLYRLVAEISRNNAVLAYSDMSVIDERGRIICPGMRNMRKHLEYVSGWNLTAKYIMDNCTAACSMLVKTQTVLDALPFYKGVFCDQWICALASSSGRIVFVDEPLVRYRRHGRNQTGSFRQINNCEDYYKKRIIPAVKLIAELEKRGVHYKHEADIKAFACARKDKNIFRIWKYRKYSRKYAYFDIFMFSVPDAVSAWALKRLRRGRRNDR